MKHAKTPHLQLQEPSHTPTTDTAIENAINYPTRAETHKDSSHKIPRLCDCVEFIYNGKEPYTLRLTSGESFTLKPKEHFIIPRGTLARWCEYKTTLFKKINN